MKRFIEAPLYAFVGIVIGCILIGIGLGGVIFR